MKETMSSDIPPSMRRRRQTDSEDDVEFGFVGATISDPDEHKT